MTTTEQAQDQPITTTDQPPDDDRRVADLQEELARVKADRSAEEERLARRAGWRRFFSTALALLAAVSIVFSLTGLWMRSTMLDSDRFAAAVGPLVKNEDVAKAISEYAAAEIVAHTGAEQEIAKALPADAQFLSGPIASGLQDGLAIGVEDVIQTDEFEAVFEGAAKVAHEEGLLILEGDGDVIESKNGLVTLNLIAVINDVMRSASADLSALFGTTINPPVIKPDQVPAEQIAELEAAIGVDLPDDFGQVTLFSSTELADAQRTVNRFDTWLEVIVIVALASTIGAFALAFDRRRTVITMGVAVPVVAILSWLLVDAAEDDYFSHISDPTGRAAARAAIDTVSSGLDRLMLWTIALSVVAVVIALVTRHVTVDDELVAGTETDGTDEAGEPQTEADTAPTDCDANPGDARPGADDQGGAPAPELQEAGRG